MNEERESVGRGLKLLLKPFTESAENPLIVKSDYCCPLENLAEDIQAQVKIHREFVNGLYEDCLAIPASCTSFRFTDLNGDLISATGLLEKFGNLRVVYATAIVVASNSSTEEWGNSGKSLLVFAEVGGIAVFPELGKVKLVTLRAEPNQWLSAGDHQNLRLSLPPSEQLFDLKSAEAQQLLIQEQSLVHVGNDPDLYLIPVHLSDESGRKLCANSMTCIPITFDPSECELVRVVNSTTVICQKLSERRIIHSIKEETLPPYVQKFCPNVFSLAVANSPMASLAQDPAYDNATTFSDNESQRNESKLCPRVSSKSLERNKRGRPKKEGSLKGVGSKKDVEMTFEEMDNIKGRADKRKVKQRRMLSKPQDYRNTHIGKCAGGPNNKVKLDLNGNTGSTDGTSALENMKAGVELESITANNQDESLNEMSQAASNLLVLADAATIKIQQIDKENDRDLHQLEGVEAAALRELPEAHEKQSEKNKSSRSTKRKSFLSSRKLESISSPRLSEVNDNPPVGEITEKTDHLLI